MIAEDTRVTKTLLAHYGIATPLVAYHEHNAAVMRPHLIARLKAGAAATGGKEMLLTKAAKQFNDTAKSNIEAATKRAAAAAAAPAAKKAKH